MKSKRKKTPAKQSGPPKTSPILTDRQEFQKAYGPQWLSIIQSAPFREGMFILDKEKMSELVTLSNEQIEKNSREILGDYRGFLKLQNDLLTLHSTEEKLPVEEPEEYLSPEQQAEISMMLEKFRDQNKQTRYGR